MKTELLRICDELATVVLNGTFQGLLLLLLVAVGMHWFGSGDPEQAVVTSLPVELGHDAPSVVSHL